MTRRIPWVSAGRTRSARPRNLYCAGPPQPRNRSVRAEAAVSTVRQKDTPPQRRKRGGTENRFQKGVRTRDSRGPDPFLKPVLNRPRADQNADDRSAISLPWTQTLTL